MGRAKALREIEKNISESGCHIYFVAGGPCPRFLYTIGLTDIGACELILAGASYFEDEDAANVIDAFSSRLLKHESVTDLEIKVGRKKIRFSLRKIDNSWRDLLMLGAKDYYDSKDFSAHQIIPEHKYSTIDVPNMSVPWSSSKEPIWKWLCEKWTHSMSEDSIAATNLDALMGKPLTRIDRWEDDTWFVLSGNSQREAELRTVPFGTFMAIDSSLEIASTMKKDEQLLRDVGETGWHETA